jgi:hypothetical protein
VREKSSTPNMNTGSGWIPSPVLMKRTRPHYLTSLFHEKPTRGPSRERCKWFNEIKDFLLKHRLQLALDTVDFPMPEHTLYAYILAEGGLSLTADEWRNFLRVCDDTSTLFMYISSSRFSLLQKLHKKTDALPRS